MAVRVVASPSSVMYPSTLNRLLAELQLPSERRRKHRTDFDYRLRLEPIGVGADAPIEGMLVRGKDLSDAGVGITHSCPLPFRKVRLTSADTALDALGVANLELEVLLRWCRFLAPGRYESGGRLLLSKDSRRVA